MPIGVYPHKKGWHHSKETRAKISRANKGRKRTPEWIAKLSKAKKKNPVRYWLGKKRPPHSLETRKKMSNSQKRINNKPPVRRGSDNNLWRGGVTPVNHAIRWSAAMAAWRKAVFVRDKHTCQSCKKQGGTLNAHHIKPFAQYRDLRFDISNGITLCESCHRSIRTSRSLTHTGDMV